MINTKSNQPKASKQIENTSAEKAPTFTMPYEELIQLEQGRAEAFFKQLKDLVFIDNKYRGI